MLVPLPFLHISLSDALVASSYHLNGFTLGGRVKRDETSTLYKQMHPICNANIDDLRESNEMVLKWNYSMGSDQ